MFQSLALIAAGVVTIGVGLQQAHGAYLSGCPEADTERAQVPQEADAPVLTAQK